MIFDNLFLTSLLAVIGLSVMVAPFSCLVVWNRMAFLGDTMAHAALLGVVMAFFLQINIFIGVFVIAGLTAIALQLMRYYQQLSYDVLLGMLAHFTLALGIIMLSFSDLQIGLHALLFGDILNVGKQDIFIIYGGLIVALIGVGMLWQRLLIASLNFDWARAEGFKPMQAQMIFILMLAAIIAVGIQVFGVLLITTFLIMPAAIARKFSKTPEQMVVGAAIFGVSASVIGLFVSFQIDIPTGPTIIVVCFSLFLLSNLSLHFRVKRKH